MPHDPNKIIEEVKEQRKKSLDWFNQNFYGEFAEIYRNIRCRVEPLKDKNGKEITDRTNVCLPDHAVMVRRKTARLTRRPPNLRVRGGVNDAQREMVSALSIFQWDRSRQQKVLRAVVQDAVAIGIGIQKDYWDKVQVFRRLRRRTANLNQEELMQARGGQASEGPLSELEVSEAIAELGDEVSLRVPTLKYEGPVGERVFFGDIFPEPGFKSLQRSAWIIEQAERDVAWLKYWLGQKTTDPETGEERPVFDERAVQELIDRGASALDRKDSQDLRRRLREAVGTTEPELEPRLRGKRWIIYERHALESGRWVIDFIGDEGVYLGRLWYPWDTYGRHLYSELVLMPDILGGIGNSSPRLTRFLLQLRNTRANQTTDFLNNILLPWGSMLDGADITEESFIKTAFGKFVQLKSHDDIRWRDNPQFPQSAWQDQQQWLSEMARAEPAMASFTEGGETTPLAGKTATSAVLTQQASDVLTEDELGQLNEFLRDVLELRLWMNQQALQEQVEINTGELSRTEAISTRTDGGEARVIRVDPLEIQEDFEILPELASTLAQDDEFKRQAAERGFMLASGSPDVFNKRAFAKNLIATLPGVNAEEALVPEPDPNQPQLPEIRMNFSIQAKFSELPGDVQAAFLGAAGLPTEGVKAQQGMKLIKELDEVGDAAQRLAGPAVDGEGGAEEGAGVGGFRGGARQGSRR